MDHKHAGERQLCRSIAGLAFMFALTACGGGRGGDGAQDSGTPPGAFQISGQDVVEGVVVKSWTEEVVGETATLQGTVKTNSGAAFSWPDGAFDGAYELRFRAGLQDRELEDMATGIAELLPANAAVADAAEMLLGTASQKVTTYRMHLPDLGPRQAYLAYAWGLAQSEEDTAPSLAGLPATFDPQTSTIEVDIAPEAFWYDESDATSSVWRVVVAIYRVDGAIILEEAATERSAKSVLGNQGLDSTKLTAAQLSVTPTNALSGTDRCPADTEPLIFPTERGIVNSHFGTRVDPLKPGKNVKQVHNAIDFRSGLGEPSRAMRPGVVLEIGYQLAVQYVNGKDESKGLLYSNKKLVRRGWGCFVMLKHDDGMLSIYAHLKCSEPSDSEALEVFRKTGAMRRFDTGLLNLPIKVGTRVETADQIAFSGATPAVPPHLHVEYFDSRPREIRKVNGKIRTVGGGSFDYAPCLAGRYFAKVDFKSQMQADFLLGGPVGATVEANRTRDGSYHCRSSHDPNTAQAIDWTLQSVQVGFMPDGTTPLRDYYCQRTRMEQRYMFTYLDWTYNFPGVEPTSGVSSASIEFVTIDTRENMLDVTFRYPGDRIESTDEKMPLSQRYYAKSSKFPGFRAFQP